MKDGEIMKEKNIVFMGTPDFAVPILKYLIDTTNVVMVVTQPDKITGRKKELVPSPVKVLARFYNIPVFQPTKLRLDYEPLKNLDIDLIVTCAYGQILSKDVLDIPKLGCVNVHASILPNYRGSAPIQWALFNNEKKTGITIYYMNEGMDSGDIIKINEIPITNDDNVGTLHDKLSALGVTTLKEVLPKILDGAAKSYKQPNTFTLAPMIKRSDERLNFNEEGNKIIGKIKGLNPWPLANIVINNTEIKVLDATFVKKDTKDTSKIVVLDKNNLGISCSDGIIYLGLVKPSGKKNMDIKSFINGNKTLNIGMVINDEN